GMVDQDKLVGMATMAQEIKKRIEIIGQDPGEKPRVKHYEDVLGRIMNMLKAFAQRLQEQAKKKGQQMNPEGMAKLQGMMLLAQTNAKIKEQSAQQKFRHKEIGFQMEQRRKNQESRVGMLRELHDAKLDAATTDIRTEAEIRNANRKGLQEMQLNAAQ